jgi:hypothetical protein
MWHNKKALGLALRSALVGRMGVAGMGKLEGSKIHQQPDFTHGTATPSSSLGFSLEGLVFDMKNNTATGMELDLPPLPPGAIGRKMTFDPLPAPDEQKVLCLECGRLRDLARTAFDMALSLNDLEYAWRRELLIVALVESNLNCEDAAHMLGVHRNTITRMMREAGIRINRQHHVLEEACLDF